MPQFTGDNRTRQGGQPVVHAKDFHGHAIVGDVFRHNASMIDMNSVLPGRSGTTVQATLEELNTAILTAGTGFISIGDVDGYATGTYNINSVDTPTIEDAFTAAFADDRLVNGGVILLLSGTYNISTTINVPTGISIMGEVAGSILNNQAIEVPMFKIARNSKIMDVNGDSGSGDVEISNGSNFGRNRFYNLILIDNLAGSVNSGNATLTTVPMIQIERGANVELDQITALGRLNDGTVLNRTKTLAVVGTTSGNSKGTSLTLNNCFIDGVKKAVNFDTQLGTLDFLTIRNCRVRYYGSEAASYSATNDCAFFASLCNLNISNNYVIGGGTQAKTLVTLGSTGGTNSVKVQLIGNSGKGPNNLFNNLVDDQTGLNTIEMISIGNNWGNIASSYSADDWYIVIGASDTDTAVGNFFGSTALNTLIRYASGNSTFDPIIYIKPGTYSVTVASSTACNLRLIGLPVGSSYPVIQLNLDTGSTDALSNRYVGIGSHIENLRIESLTNYSSLRLTWNVDSSGVPDISGNYQNIFVRNCIFRDVTAYLNATNGGSSNHIVYQIANCQFEQTTTFADNLSLAIPKGHVGSIDNCVFAGSGYGIAYSGIYTAPAIVGKLTIANCYFDLLNAEINSAAPGTAESYYLDLNDVNTDITIENCHIRTSPADTLFNGVTTDRMVNISALNINLINCNFNFPGDTYTSGVVYSLAGIYINWNKNITISNCSFSGSTNNLKIIGNDNSMDNCIIHNNTFDNFSSSAAFTLLDIETDIEIVKRPLISICNNDFHNAQTAAGRTVQHSFVTGSAYNCRGIVQVYSKGSNVIFNNNAVHGTLISPLSDVPTHMAAVYLNSYDDESGATTRLNSISAANNNINIIGGTWAPGSSAGFGANLFTRGSALQINNNILNYNNTGSATSGFRGNLVLDSILLGSAGDSNVSGNLFRRTDLTGNLTSLDRGYVLITSNTNYRGQIIGNSFDSPTIDGYTTTVVEDNSSVDWLIERNKNQTKVTQIYGTQGVFALNRLTTTRIVAGNNTDTMDSFIAINPNPQIGGTGNVIVSYVDTTDTVTAYWDVNVSSVVPHGAYLVNVSIDLDVSATPDTGNVTLTINDNLAGGADSDSVTGLTTAGDTLSVTLLENEYISGVDSPFIELVATLDDTGTFTFETGPLNITYRY